MVHSILCDCLRAVLGQKMLKVTAKLASGCYVYAILGLVLSPTPTQAQATAKVDTPPNVKQSTKAKDFPTDVCERIETEAKTHNIPKEFFARLIWKESRFNPNAVSPVGAQGIAQFMPATAARRQLNDPFNYAEALPASARFLADLRDQFGNLGLAAAPYNAGENRIERWLKERATLPLETEDYVRSITGLEAAAWAAKPTEVPRLTLSKDLAFQAACQKLASRQSAPVALAAVHRTATWKPWGVQLAAHFSRSRALRIYAGLRKRFATVIGNRQPQVVRARNLSFGRRSRFNIRLGEASRRAALGLCNRLRKVGGACVVVKNGR